MLILLTDCYTFLAAVVGRIEFFVKTSSWKWSQNVFSFISTTRTAEFQVIALFIGADNFAE